MLKPFKDFFEKLTTTRKIDTSLSQIERMIESNHAKAHISNITKRSNVKYVANITHDPQKNRYNITVTKNGKPFTTASSQVHLTTGNYSPQRFTAAVLKLHDEFYRTPKSQPRKKISITRPKTFTPDENRLTIKTWGKK